MCFASAGRVPTCVHILGFRTTQSLERLVFFIPAASIPFWCTVPLAPSALLWYKSTQDVCCACVCLSPIHDSHPHSVPLTTGSIRTQIHYSKFTHMQAAHCCPYPKPCSSIQPGQGTRAFLPVFFSPLFLLQPSMLEDIEVAQSRDCTHNYPSPECAMSVHQWVSKERNVGAIRIHPWPANVNFTLPRGNIVEGRGLVASATSLNLICA